MNWRKPSERNIEHDGRWFDSRLEAAVYLILKERENAGEIKILRCQSQVFLSHPDEDFSDFEIIYKPDFKILDFKTNSEEYVEAKGLKSKKWMRIKNVWRKYGPAKLTIYEGDHIRPRISEIIIPERMRAKND